MTTLQAEAPVIVEHGVSPTGDATAVFDPSRTYRYQLTRRWADGVGATFIMLNPSTATAEVDDPTIRRCVAFARREGCGALKVMNLFALRSRDPQTLRTHPDPVGPDNDTYLAAAHGLVIAAWGIHGSLGDRDQHVARLLEQTGVTPMCLGHTHAGSPRHPLYIRRTAPLTPWRTP